MWTLLKPPLSTAALAHSFWGTDLYGGCLEGWGGVLTGCRVVFVWPIKETFAIHSYFISYKLALRYSITQRFTVCTGWRTRTLLTDFFSSTTLSLASVVVLTLGLLAGSPWTLMFPSGSAVMRFGVAFLLVWCHHQVSLFTVLSTVLVHGHRITKLSYSHSSELYYLACKHTMYFTC